MTSALKSHAKVVALRERVAVAEAQFRRAGHPARRGTNRAPSTHDHVTVTELADDTTVATGCHKGRSPYCR